MTLMMASLDEFVDNSLHQLYQNERLMMQFRCHDQTVNALCSVVHECEKFVAQLDRRFCKMNSHHTAFCSKLLQKPEICKQPPSSVIHRLASFLPQLKASNVELDEQLQTSPDEVNIENVKTDDLVVEMNIAVIEREGSIDSSTEASSDEETDDSDDSLDNTCAAAAAAFPESSSPSSVRLPKLKLAKVCSKNKCKPSIQILPCVESSDPTV